MLYHLWQLIWLATCTVNVCAWEHGSAVDFEGSLKGHEVVVVAFTAPSEHKSKALELEWQRAAPESKVPFLSIDCTSPSESAICEQYGVSSYPSVKLFSGGHVKSTYRGPRRATAILAWADRVQRPAVSDVDEESLTSFKLVDETVFVAYLDSGDGPSRAAFGEVASHLQDEFTFGVSTDPTNIAEEIKDAPAVKCYKPLDGDTLVYRGLFDTASLESFFKEASRPVIGELLPHNHQRFLDRQWPMIYIFASTESERAELRSSLKKLARSQYELLTMVTVDTLEFPELPAKLGLDPGEYPAGAVHQLSTNKIYPYPRGQPVTAEYLKKWGLDVWQGRIQPWTPPGVAPTPSSDTPGRVAATRKVSIRSFPGMKINIGRDEL